MDSTERQAMMKSLLEEFFAGMSTDEKKDLCAAMMEKLTQGVDMKAMMPRMMMGMMSGGPGGPCGSGGGPAHMREMMAGMHGKAGMGGAEGQGAAPPMPEMMLTTMMPHCIGMMLPAIDPDKRADAAAAILSALVEKGTADLSESQASAFRARLEEVLAG